ncbi:hypothetical protein [Mycobacterium europaeum]|uniref:hypothetical protein n=1 Tax=Mycobacterium europaeum TaxID=761804 RepID=UPI001FCA9D37|nr:hypothetical protein [Mycobacterium europaeum]
MAEVGLEFTVEVLQRQDLGDSGDVDATGDQGTDALQAHHVVIAITDHYMRKYGATREDFGRLCVAQRDNALSNPLALQRRPLTLEDYLAARPICDPVHLYDCVMPCAGAEAFIVTTPEIAERRGLRTACILSTIERHNAFPDDPVQWRGGGGCPRRSVPG